MKTTIHFYLGKTTAYGENIFLTGNKSELGTMNLALAKPMQYLNKDFWHLEVEFDLVKGENIHYHYVLQGRDGSLVQEVEKKRNLLGEAQLDVIDHWGDSKTMDYNFLTTPFSAVFFKKNTSKQAKQSPKQSSHVFKIKAPLLAADEALCLMGDSAVLGAWNTESPQHILHFDGDWWQIGVDLSDCHFPIGYKYGVYNTKSKAFVAYETGENRMLYGNNPHCTTVLHEGFARLAQAPFRAAGVAVPIFSLRSEMGMGVGEFTDLPALADWANTVGLRLLQILPINDTSATGTWTDSYPYASISAFALHPLYLNIEALAGAAHAKAVKPLLKKKTKLNALTQVDYEAVLAVKSAAIDLVYKKEAVYFRLEKPFQEFYESNKKWLLPYAAFCCFRDENGGEVDFLKWKTNQIFQWSEVEAMNEAMHPAFTKIGRYLFVQYHLHLQLKNAVAYCHEKGLAVKGDIPIGIYRYSADAWTEPELYNMNAQAGAPPDDFAVAGQNWGFPTYNWERMKADGFAWWARRFNQMSNYFDAFRIDHILGFFRIWSIPMDAVQGILGYFSPAIPIQLDEFQKNGINFDYDRFCKPHITDAVLKEVFGPNSYGALATYLNSPSYGVFRLKPAFDTQRKVEAYFETLEKTERNESLRDGLYQLIANVILIPDKTDLRGFHFRITMDKTSSFKHLNEHIKTRLRSLYNNYFYVRQDEFWKKEAMEKLPDLKQATDMLICGEDLGMVPNCVPEVMENLAILTLEIQRMPKNPQQAFFHPKDAPYLSVVTPSTHDMSPIRLWWEEDAALTQRFYNEILGHSGQAPKELSPELAQTLVAQHLWSSAMLSIFQFQDIFAIDGTLRQDDIEIERINVPANPKHYWRYRMHISLEKLQKEAAFNSLLKGMVLEAGR